MSGHEPPNGWGTPTELPCCQRAHAKNHGLISGEDKRAGGLAQRDGCDAAGSPVLLAAAGDASAMCNVARCSPGLEWLSRTELRGLARSTPLSSLPDSPSFSTLNPRRLDGRVPHGREEPG